MAHLIEITTSMYETEAQKAAQKHWQEALEVVDILH